MMGRIVKQFQQAIKLNSAGKPIPYDELPTPPGYALIPGAPQPVQAPPEESPTPPPRRQQVNHVFHHINNEIDIDCNNLNISADRTIR